MASETPLLKRGTLPSRLSPEGVARAGLLTIQALVGMTALAGGLALIFGALNPQAGSVITPPVSYLADTPFASYVVPGLLLAGLIGGVHLAALGMGWRRQRWSIFAAAVAAFAMLIWIFVQMIFIPFSFLQAVYFVAGIAEAGLVMLALGILRPLARGAAPRLRA